MVDDLNQKIFTQNNIILSNSVYQLNELINQINDEILAKRFRDIILIMNKTLNENKSNYEKIIKLIENLNKKIDLLSNYNMNNGSKIVVKNYPEGRYEGELVNNKREGKGKMYYLNNQEYLGKVYDGEWKNDLREGKGIEAWSDGERFEGYFKNDKRIGKGIYYFNKGDRYEGEFKNGKKDGFGIYYYENGNKKIGNFFNDNIIGKYIYITASNEIYIKEDKN